MAARKGNVTRTPTKHPRKITITAEKDLHIAFKVLCDQDDRDVSDVLRETMIIAIQKGHLNVYANN